MVWLHDSSYIVSASDDKTLKLWDVASVNEYYCLVCIGFHLASFMGGNCMPTIVMSCRVASSRTTRSAAKHLNDIDILISIRKYTYIHGSSIKNKLHILVLMIDNIPFSDGPLAINKCEQRTRSRNLF